MIRKELLKTIIADSQSSALPEVWQRDLTIPLDSGKIITLIGVRRSGKTYHLFEVMRTLRLRGVPAERILYINFGDERLQLRGEEMDIILQAYRELHPEIDLAGCYFLFDEIQEVPGWEKFVDRLYGSVSRNIFITGSNSKLLSREIATALRGRTVSFEVYPLSFAEFVRVADPGAKLQTSAGRARAVQLFKRFMQQGGFPEITVLADELHERVLQEYFNVMLLRDLVERYQVSQVAILKYFCKRVVGASAGEFSVNKVYNELKSQGYHIGKDTLYGYQDNAEAIYLTRFIPKYSPSVVKSEGSHKKAYVIDQGLGAALDFKLSQDAGRLLETVAALELLKQGKSIAYWQDGVECDFVVIEKGQVSAALQVSLDISDEATRQREIKGLVRCCHSFGLESGVILTLDSEERLVSGGVQVEVMPVWRYFCQGSDFQPR